MSTCSLVHLGNNVLEYQEKVKYLGVLLNDKLNDNDDIMKQMRGLYARANSVLRKFACSFEVKLRLFQAFCTQPIMVCFKTEPRDSMMR